MAVFRFNREQDFIRFLNDTTLLRHGVIRGVIRKGEFGGAVEVVTQPLPDADFERNVEEYVGALALKSASALALTKGLLYHLDGMNLEAALQSGVYVNALARGTADAQRGIAEFLRKRK